MVGNRAGGTLMCALEMLVVDSGQDCGLQCSCQNSGAKEIQKTAPVSRFLLSFGSSSLRPKLGDPVWTVRRVKVTYTVFNAQN